VNVRDKKRELRRQVLSQRDALSEGEIREKSHAIQSFLFSLPEFDAARAILYFVSFRSEVSTEGMIRALLARGTVVVVPLADLKSKRLHLYRLEDFDRDLSPGTWGIPEPSPRRSKPFHLKEVDLVVTPGVAFDESGARVGYGGGFYDRLLEEWGGRGPSVALAFELQVLHSVPFDGERDIPVDIIVTEKRTIRCKG
jgi:5-formyltetrahydrofolate cyclo-ligase